MALAPKSWAISMLSNKSEPPPPTPEMDFVKTDRTTYLGLMHRHHVSSNNNRYTCTIPQINGIWPPISSWQIRSTNFFGKQWAIDKSEMSGDDEIP